MIKGNRCIGNNGESEIKHKTLLLEKMSHKHLSQHVDAIIRNKLA